MDVSKIRQRLVGLRGQREHLERQLIETRRRLVAGCLSSRYTECRKGGCRCTQGRPHGPFLYAVLLIRGRSRYRYVGKPGDRPLVEGLTRYRGFQESLEGVRRLNREINTLWNRYRQGLLK